MEFLPAGFAYPRRLRRLFNWNLCAHRGFDGRAKPAECFEMGGGVECFGTLDLIVAPATALYFQARVLNIYPLDLVPLFLGPPLGILTHILSLRNLTVTRSAAP
jgi:hypothetical protein